MTTLARASSLILCVAAFAATGCTERSTAIVVELDIVGSRASEARRVDIRLACVDQTAPPVRRAFDLGASSGGGEAPTLAIEPGDSGPCRLAVEAQLRGFLITAQDWPIAAAREEVDFVEGRITHVTLRLDTDACSTDLDGDGHHAGGGCDPAEDCDDLDPEEHAGAEEVCDGKDNDCDGDVDDLAPFGAVGCPEDGTALVVTFEVTGESAGEAEAIDVGYRCTGSEASPLRQVLLLSELEAGEAPSLSIHPNPDGPCTVELVAQALGALDEAEVRWPLASASAALDFAVGEVARQTVTLDTEVCSDLDGDERSVGADAGEECFDTVTLDCDDLGAMRYAGAVEQCNHEDDDCDGEADERPDHGPWCEAGNTFLVVEFELVGEEVENARRIEVAWGPTDRTVELERLHIELDAPEDGDRLSLSIQGEGEDDGDRVLYAQLVGTPDGEDAPRPMASAGRRFAFTQAVVRRVHARLETDACADADGDGDVAGPADCAADPDCDDLAAAVHLGARERCDGRDTDCNGEVDDLTDDSIREACPSWDENNGLCQLDGVRPVCRDDELECPAWLEEGADDCDLFLDTNCDGAITDCGCNPGVVCGACQEAECVGMTTRCEYVDPETFDYDGDLAVGEPCSPPHLESCRGAIACHSEPENLFCEYTVGGPEICDDGDEIDEDCDGLVDGEEHGCEVLEAVDTDCPRLRLSVPMASGDPIPTPCTMAYATGRCVVGLPPGEEGSGSTAPISVVLDLPPGVTVEHVSNSCCTCSIAVVSRPGSGATLAIDTSGWHLFTEVVGELEIRLNLHYSASGAPAAILENVPLIIPIHETPTSDMTTGACLSDCGA